MAEHSDSDIEVDANADERFEIAHVYKMINDHPEVKNMVYVGSTPRDLTTRKIEHQCAARLGIQKYKFYRAMFKYGIDRFDIEELETLRNVTSAELHAREEYWINKLDSITNGFNDKHGNGWCDIHDCDRRRCPCGGSHCCGCEHKAPCKTCHGAQDAMGDCKTCDGKGTRIVFVRREQCSTHGGKQMCPKHKDRSKAYCPAFECKETATGLCEKHWPSRKHECSTCKACPICPNDENRAPANPKHLDGKKHKYNARLRTIIIDRANPMYRTSELREKYIDLVINFAEQNERYGKPSEPFQRLSDHRRLKAYQTRLDAYLASNPSSFQSVVGS
jgi:hypothetical protein